MVSGNVRGQGNSGELEQLKTGSENSVMIKSMPSTSVGNGGNSVALARRESGSGNRTTSTSALSRLSSGSSKLLRSSAAGCSQDILGSNDGNVGDNIARTNSHVTSITSATNIPSSGGGKNFSSVGRSASASAASAMKNRNTLDVYYGQPEPR